MLEITESNKLLGIYLGKVEFNLDPLQRGRVKVRVYHIDDEDTPIEDLNWAEVINIGGVGWDMGNINIPEVGSTVYVSYLNGNPNKPLVIGGFYKHNANDNIYVYYDDEGLRKYIYDDYNDLRNVTTTPLIVTPHNINEYPIESQTLLNNQPTKKITKSLKGHTIIIEDRDGDEAFEIIDRAGQIFKFKSNVLKEYNGQNRNKRGIKRTDSKNTFNDDKFEDESTEICLMDIKGQEFKIRSKKGLESIKLKSTNKSELQEFELSVGKNNIELSMKNAKIILNNGEVSIYADNNININSKKDIILTAQNIIQSEENELNDEFFTGID